ncbi:MAG: hypothetical protein ACM3O6_09945, partial [Acidobacteriota bacterium]
MNLAKLALSLLAALGAGCATAPSAPVVAMSDLPDCSESNYDAERGLFTIRNAVGDPANQQCLLRVGPRGDAAAAPRLRAGSYTVSLANGGGGGAGGTVQAMGGGGGGGGGGAGSAETRATVNLAEGTYRLTIGAGGPGGSACSGGPIALGGGPGWIGSPTNMVRVATGEVVAGTPGADKYARPTRAQNERFAGRMDAHGGSGPGQSSGGHAGLTTDIGGKVEATAGASKLASGHSAMGGEPGVIPRDDQRSGSGGGGGATSIGHGGTGGGETAGNKD